MSAFSERLRFAITNYASGSVPYKSFAALVDIPYRTLQNYLSGERSPNTEALEKLSNNGIDINWLITGRGTPYNRDNIEKKLLDKIFLIYALDIIKNIFDPKNDMFDRGEKYAILSFIMRNNYLKIGDNLHDLLDYPDYYKSLEDMEFELASGKLEEEVFDLPPRNKIEMWKALQILKEKRGRDIIPPRAIESGWPETKDVGE